MDQQSQRRIRPARRVLAGLCAACLGAACGADASPGPAGDAGAAPRARHRPDIVYSIVNLPAEEGAAAFLNEAGQVAFRSYAFGNNGFFDGERVHELGSLGGGYTAVAGLNGRGMVVGESAEAGPAGAVRAFRWTRDGGMQALPGPDGSAARAVNDRGQVVGRMPAAGVTARAVRWEPGGRIVELGPAPLSLSEAQALNEQGVAGGFGDVRGGRIHATVWDPAGRAIDLGAMGGARGFTLFVNRRGEAAGTSDMAAGDREQGFFWSPRGGRVATGARGGSRRLVAALNERGEVAGNTERAGGNAAYLWSRARGLVLLPGGSNEVIDMNGRSDMVGWIEQPGRGQRAVRWSGIRMPVDLNSRLHRPPPGLRLHAATAINDAGAILADSNAGLVLLLPGKRGTPAPVLGPLTGLPDTVEIGKELVLKIAFASAAPALSYTARAVWSDGCRSPPPRVRATGDGGEVTLRHRVCAPGDHRLTLEVAADGRHTTLLRRRLVVTEAGTKQPASGKP